jgi:hypothetical protein
MQKWELLILRRLELRPLGRPARRQSLNRLSYRGSNDKVVPILNYPSTALFKDGWRTEGMASALLISAPDGGEREASCSGCFFSRDKSSRYQLCTRLCVAQRQSGRCVEVTFLYRELNPDSAAVQPVHTGTEVFLLLLIQPLASWIKELPSKTWSSEVSEYEGSCSFVWGSVKHVADVSDEAAASTIRTEEQKYD